MSRLFVCLYLDEDVDVVVSDILRAKGFDVITTRDSGNLQATDEEQLEYAISQNRALVTHNRIDFEALIQSYLSRTKFTTE